MRPFWRDDHTLRLSLVGISLTLIYVTILVPLGFLEGLRASSQDTLVRWRNGLTGPPELTRQILLVTVDDESQRRLNQKWPWDRRLFAQALRQLTPHQPKLVLFDFAFVGKSNPESDEELASAIQGAGPTLLAAYLDPKGEVMLPDPEFVRAGGIIGFINKLMDRDYIVRRVLAVFPVPGRSEPVCALEIEAAALASGVALSELRMQGRSLGMGNRRIPLGPLGELPINYLASDEQIPSIPFWKILEGSFSPDQIRGKLVLIGSSREITHDVHSTPLGRMAGVAIGANTVLTLLTGRFWNQIPLWLTLLLALALTIGVLQATFHGGCTTGLCAFIGFSLLGIGGALALASLNFSSEPFSPILLAAAAGLTGNLYKYLRLAVGTFRLQQVAVTEPLTRGATARYFHLALQRELLDSERSKKPVGLLVIQIDPIPQLLHEQSWEEIRKQLREMGKRLMELLPHGGLLGRLGEDQWGILLPRQGLSRITEFAARARESLRFLPGSVRMGIASTEQAPIRSASDLIRCAQTAALQTPASAKGSAVWDPSSDEVRLFKETPLKEEPSPSHLEQIASELEERNLALERSLAELRQLHRQMESSFLEVTKSLVLAMETKDSYTAGHLERVSEYAARLARELGLPREETEAIREAALLHDIGKIGLPDEVLHKIGDLTEEEREVIKEHLMIGAKILEPMKFFKPITSLIYHHHEWYNGKGYPHGLAGDFIPSGAQVIAIADAFDAMTTRRSYNEPMTTQEALAELKRGAGTQFNPRFVEAFGKIF
ncbi:MAG: CHASE2 domain-containing protein [Candidatus Omnitrophica bacterium]|nr:CHASE2 domain-containing protein [Candidatus Omnitrophota bacterium]